MVTNQMKTSFAIINSLKPQLTTAGLTEESVWEWVKSEYDVQSRSELNEESWAIVSARLSAAQRDQQLFSVLCEAVKSAVGTCRVYRVYNNGTFRKVYDGIITEGIQERCQQYADATGCYIRMHGADGEDGIEKFIPEEYAPDPNCPPTRHFDPTRPRKVYEIHQKGNETHRIEVRFPDCSDLAGWGQRHADSSGFDTIITDQMGHNVLMQFAATPAPAPPSIVDVQGDVKIDGQAWTLLNQWDDQWHWVKMTQSMERYIATADNRDAAIAALVVYIRK